MIQEDWHTLSRFESHDLVKSWYKTTHGIEPNAAKIAHVNAQFRQGREYFKNAVTSDMSVKPLLLYYGVLSLSRGAIMLNDSAKKEESLKQQHGLQVVDWQPTLSKGIKNVLELQIRATDGTFRELTEACSNKHSAHCFNDRTNSQTVVNQELGTIGFSTDCSLLSLDDLLSRLRQTIFDYQTITGRKSQWFPVVVTQHSAETRFALVSNHVLPYFQDLVDGDSVTLIASSPQRANLQVGDMSQFSLVFKHEQNRAHQAKFPLFHYDEGSPIMIGILDFPNKDKLSEFFKLYLTSFMLGMLVRYFPSKWMDLLRNAPGDFAQPLLFQAIQAIESDFPKELSLQVQQHPTTLA